MRCGLKILFKGPTSIDFAFKPLLIGTTVQLTQPGLVVAPIREELYDKNEILQYFPNCYGTP